MEKFCGLVGMDKEKLLLSWEACPTPAKFSTNERFKRFVGTFYASTGVERCRSSAGATLEDREVLWKNMFGMERAAMLMDRVNESWPDYQFLRSKRLC